MIYWAYMGGYIPLFPTKNQKARIWRGPHPRKIKAPHCLHHQRFPIYVMGCHNGIFLNTGRGLLEPRALANGNEYCYLKGQLNSNVGSSVPYDASCY